MMIANCFDIEKFCKDLKKLGKLFNEAKSAGDQYIIYMTIVKKCENIAHFLKEQADIVAKYSIEDKLKDL